MTTADHNHFPGAPAVADTAHDAVARADAGAPIDLARRISVLWCDALNAEAVGLDDDFFELGGNSISAVRLLPLFSERLGVDITISVMFDHPTPRELGEQLHAMGAAVRVKAEDA